MQLFISSNCLSPFAITYLALYSYSFTWLYPLRVLPRSSLNIRIFSHSNKYALFLSFNYFWHFYNSPFNSLILFSCIEYLNLTFSNSSLRLWYFTIYSFLYFNSSSSCRFCFMSCSTCSWLVWACWRFFDFYERRLFSSTFYI